MQAAISSLTYTIPGVSHYFWFCAPMVRALAVLVAEGSLTLVRTLEWVRLPRPLVTGLAELPVIALPAPSLVGAGRAARHIDRRCHGYSGSGQRFEAHTHTLEVDLIGRRRARQ